MNRYFSRTFFSTIKEWNARMQRECRSWYKRVASTPPVPRHSFAASLHSPSPAAPELLRFLVQATTAPNVETLRENPGPKSKKCRCAIISLCRRSMPSRLYSAIFSAQLFSSILGGHNLSILPSVRNLVKTITLRIFTIRYLCLLSDDEIVMN